MQQELENHTNSAKQRGNRPLTTEAETQRRKNLSRPEMMSMNYHHSLSKLYLKAYNDTFLKVTVEELRDFIGFEDKSFLDLLDMMSQDKFPSFSKNLSSDKGFMNQPIPLSLYDGLLRLRQKEGLDDANKDQHLIRKSIIKQLYLITLLLNGIGQIDQKVMIIQQNESKQTFFRRKVSWFLNRTTLLTPRVFYWYVMYWDWVMETVQRTLKEYDEEQKIEKKRGRIKKILNQVNLVKSNEEQSNNIDYEESMKNENLLSNFNYDQVEPNIHAAIEKLNYLKLRNKKPYEIDVQNNNDDDSELKIVERTIKQTYKRKLQEKILKKRQQNRKIKNIQASNSQKYEQKSKTTQKQEKKKQKVRKFITSHLNSQEKIIQKHPSTRQHCETFVMGAEGPYELVMKDHDDIDPCEFYYQHQISSLMDNPANSEQPLNSTSVQNVSQSQRLRQNNHNINQMNPIITNLLIRRQVIGQTIATEIYYALINTNIRLIEQNNLIEKQPF